MHFKKSLVLFLCLTFFISAVFVGCTEQKEDKTENSIESDESIMENSIEVSEESVIDISVAESEESVIENVLKGKTFMFLGSSVTYGVDNISFVEYIARNNDCTCKKQAVSGTTLVDNGASSYVQRMLNNINKNESFDHFICQLSTNDASQNKPLGKVSDSKKIEDFDTTTIIGAMEYIIAYASSTWDCPVSFYTGTYYNSALYQKMVDALYELQDKWGIGIIDLWNNPEMRNVSSQNYTLYMSDQVHPTKKGYEEWWTPVFEEYFRSYYA
ncbi:MAG: SGNH/GDSL hydrolase family protein [Firmicutes bacterium HGW-Firmicutes-21]|nr:MAG: SGNH/GDSL hydrolase family protein [Firmicutes bacterium HGW-Firmicutes-21]